LTVSESEKITFRLSALVSQRALPNANLVMGTIMIEPIMEAMLDHDLIEGAQ